jgi:hypothetical protein
MMNAKQERVYDVLCDLTGEQAANAFLNYCGTQLLDDGFHDFMVDEGYALESVFRAFSNVLSIAFDSAVKALADGHKDGICDIDLMRDALRSLAAKRAI